jgi:transcriptional regulator with XRE-family HTH domain
MLSHSLGPLLKSARQQLGLSRDALAAKAGVSLRLVAEFERGQRSNVSLESALRLLKAVGITVVARAPHGAAAEIRGTAAERLERAARAAQRRETWTGRHVHLRDSGDDPRPPRSLPRRIASVAAISDAAYAVAASGRGRPGVTGRKRPPR